MLIKCPECESQISDKAFACPHCGCPVKSDKPQSVPRQTSRHKRLPNGFGQITELKDQNLRNRFRDMITTGKTAEGKPITKLLKPQSYFPTYNDAYKALVEYNKNPYELDSVITFQELYERWSKGFYKNYTPSGVRSYKSAWSYCAPLYRMRVADIRTPHLKSVIEEASLIRNGEKVEASAGVKSRMKSMFNLLMDYAMEYDLVSKNYARTFSLSNDVLKEIQDSKVDHIAFDDYELKKLWDNVDEYSYAGYILYQCYSGWRPSEMCLITLSDVHLKEGYIEGGLKTEAGRHRIVPIHPKVRGIVEKEYQRAKDLQSDWLFNWLEPDKYKKRGLKLSYDRYRRIFHGIITALNLNHDHKPHDPRKTFVTLAKRYKMDDFAIKRMVGHEIDDITEIVYTERSLEWYTEEMQKIK